MTDDEVSAILMQGAAAWNAWRERNPGSQNLAAPQWYDCRDSSGRQVKGRNRLNFSGMNLSNLSIQRAFAEGLSLQGSVFENSHFEEGDFSRANFSEATFRNTKFNKTILTGANFEGATFVNCNLNRVNLVGASFCVKEITETVVYGIAAWDLKTCEKMKQSKLVIEKTYDFYTDLIAQGKVPMTVDDIELAQFVYYLSDHKKMRDVINILTDKGVLLLGQFKNGGLGRLYSMREWLQGKGYMAMIFDFARPDSQNLTETVITMAAVSKFIVADLSGRSVPAELQAIVSQFKKPILALGVPYALVADLADRTRVRAIEVDEANILKALESKLPEMEQLYSERIMELARRDAKK